jgi:hypothetical protein
MISMSVIFVGTSTFSSAQPWTGRTLQILGKAPLHVSECVYACPFVPPLENHAWNGLQTGCVHTIRFSDSGNISKV